VQRRSPLWQSIRRQHGARLHSRPQHQSRSRAPLRRYTRGTNIYDPQEPGGLRQVQVGRIVRCPWHQWEFDLTTGQTLADPNRRIRTYQVDVTDGEVFVTA
jgi:hypothetical protein